MPRFLIVGAGAIGGLLGARLAAAGEEVTLVGRAWLQEAVTRHGLRLRSGDETLVTRDLAVFTSLHDALAARSYDWLLVTPRAHAVPATLDELVAATSDPPPLVLFQNGVGSEEQAAARVGAARVVAATITTPVEVLGAAHLATVDKGGIGLARWDERGPDTGPLGRALSASGFAVRGYEDARAMKWSKLLLNMIGNATSALLGWPPARTMADPRLYAVEIGALREARRVMAALGVAPVSLPGYSVPLQMLFNNDIVGGSRGGKMPSLFLALEAGQPQSEVTVLNGAVAAQGARLGVPTPLNEALTALVVSLAEGRLPRTAYLHDPDALLGALPATR